jgi:hypothetical protein
MHGGAFTAEITPQLGSSPLSHELPCVCSGTMRLLTTSNDRTTIELSEMRSESSVTSSEVLSLDFFGGGLRNTTKYLSQYRVSEPRFESGTSRMQSRYTIHSITIHPRPDEIYRRMRWSGLLARMWRRRRTLIDYWWESQRESDH